MYVTCPFCDEETEVYIWSFAGGGKKCSNNGCKAHLTRMSGAFLEIEVSEAQFQIMKDLKQFTISDRDEGWMPSKQSLNALMKKELISYVCMRGHRSIEWGYTLTELGDKCLSNQE